ncbi:MAG: RDD family protein [Planctomycetaceae bacterium]|nr:RDD family protein [Planctomycetaceae bacterium]
MWRRGIAFLIDLVPIGILAVFENAVGIADQIWIGVPNLVLVFAYFAGMNYRFGGTLGKQWMGLRVALPQSPQVLSQLLVRCLVKLLCLAPPLIWVSAMMAIWRHDQRTLHDLAADSVVVEYDSLLLPRSPNLMEKLLASSLLFFGPLVLMVLVFLLLFGGIVVLDELLRRLP